MFTLAHLSDLHMAVEPRGSQLLSKRGLGYVNWLRKRKKIHRPEVLDALVGDLKTQSFDHIAVTGDLVNFSLPDEYARAR
ncbi:MAG: metallophosphoesterase [Xanthobacteraceae bacterium]